MERTIGPVRQSRKRVSGVPREPKQPLAGRRFRQPSSPRLHRLQRRSILANSHRSSDARDTDAPNEDRFVRAACPTASRLGVILRSVPIVASLPFVFDDSSAIAVACVTVRRILAPSSCCTVRVRLMCVPIACHPWPVTEQSPPAISRGGAKLRFLLVDFADDGISRLAAVSWVP